MSEGGGESSGNPENSPPSEEGENSQPENITLDSQPDNLSGQAEKPPDRDQNPAGAVSPWQIYRKSTGKTVDITCRVCDKIMKYQNYMTHLKAKHPEEDSKNLRGKSD